MKTSYWLAILASVVLALGGCGTKAIKKDPAAPHRDYSGKDFSGAYAVVRVASDIPHVPLSKGKQARWSKIEVDQMLYLDAHCQSELFKQLPDWAQAIVKEGGWSALATAVGEGAFASAFPGVEVAHYVLGGLGFGTAIGANTGRYRQESSLKGSQGYCVLMQVWDVRNRYSILEGILPIPWSGNGAAKLPKASDATSAPTLPPANRSAPPLLH